MSRPNILLITSDQQHWFTLGCLNPEVKTPNLDRLAAEGMLFTRAYCPNPTCTPTRASMITGKYPSQHGAWSLGTKLPESEPTLGAMLSAAGYRTALVGKAHFQQLQTTPEYPSIESYPIMQDLDYWREFHGPFYGFDHVELARNHADEAHCGQHYAIWMEERGCANWRDYYQVPTGKAKAQRHHWPIPEAYHYDTWIADRTNALMADYAREEAPFFLWASFFDPHPPYLVPAPWDTMYDPEKITVPAGVEGEFDRMPPHYAMTQQQRPDFSGYQEPGGNGCHGFHSHLTPADLLRRNIAVYYGMISLMDKYIGQILDQLDRLGLAERTLVVFSTDHGHFYGHHNLTAKGAFAYEDMVRVPFIVRQPGTVPAGRTSDAIQSLVDLPQSFLAHCGLDAPAEMTGVDQLAVWRGECERARDHAIVEFHHQPTTIHTRTYIDQRYKLTIYYQREYGELFDLQDDPGEFVNRWDDPHYRDRRRQLLRDFLLAEIAKEEPLDSAALLRPNKSLDACVKTVEDERYRLVVDPANRRFELIDRVADPAGKRNLWADPASAEARESLIRQLLNRRLGAEPLWMPRVCGA